MKEATLRARLAFTVLAWSLAFAAPAADLTEAARQVVEATNAFRKAQGREPVSVDPALERAAREFAGFMAKTGKYGHGADGRTPAQRAVAQGYEYCIVLENIAWLYRSSGYGTAALAEALVEGWKGSPEHRRNMLNTAVTQTGVGIAQGEGGRYYAVQMFGRPKSAAIRFSVRNRAGEMIEYRAAGRSFSLAPRATRTHTVCRPPTLRVELSKPFTARPGNGASYTVVERSGGLAVITGAF